MTAIVGVLNKHAVAIAADSAVTLGGGRKVLNSANKLFALSKRNPVAVAIYGSADLVGTPWEIIIKEYRKQLDESFNGLKGYIDNFMEFLYDNNYFCSDKESVEDLYSSILQFTLNIIKVAEEDPGKIDIIIKNLEKKSASTYLDGVTPGIVSSLKEQAKKVFPCANNEFSACGFNITEDRFLSLVETAFTKDVCPLAKRSGLVFSGYGEKDLFPSIYDYSIGGIIDNVLMTKQLKVSQISKEKGSDICPFAQTDVMKTILEGVAPKMQSIYLSSLEKTFQKLTDALSSYISPKDATLAAAVKNMKIDTFKTIFMATSKITQEEEYSKPFVDSVSSLEKEDLADFAESLVRLTSLKRRISKEQDTVGGPIDVMVISKGDGIIWMKRKHYFNPDLNHQFFDNYFNQ
ncbi:MAG: hypothetical protein IJ552_11560 [Prevotella sp.]|nr:hypothetical protein [Prevotella sp.]